MSDLPPAASIPPASSPVSAGPVPVPRPVIPMAPPAADPELAPLFVKIGLPLAERHLLFCIGPDCCSSHLGEATWEHAKRRLRDTRLQVMRSKAACLRLCTRGPWLVVYPEGIWYDQVTPERFDRILAEHLRGGRPVQEWVQAEQPMRPLESAPGPASPSAQR